MNTKKLAALGLAGVACVTTNVNAQEYVYGEDIPVGSESEYVFVENENITDAYTDLTNEEANSLKVSLEASGYTTVSIRSYMVKTGVITNNIEKSFDSYEDALAYIADLEASGLTVENVVFTKDTTVVSDTLNETYDTLAEAEAALNAFINEYNENTQVNDIVRVPDSTEDTTETFNQDFDVEQDADDYLDSQLALNSEDVVVTGTKTRSDVDDASVNIDETFETQEAADARLAALRNEYDVVDSSNITVVKAGTIYEAEWITEYEREYLIGNTTYIIIKKGGTIYVWTENELTADEIAEFKRTYPNFQVDPAISSVNNAVFIHGLNSEYVTSNDKLFEIVERDGKTYAVMAPGSVSHVVYGKFIDVSEYHLTATVHNIITTWNVSGSKLTKGYDYQVSASGSKTVELESGVLTATTTEDEMTEFYALDLVRQKFEYVGGTGEAEEDEEEPVAEEVEVTNPSTGDESLWVFTIGGISMIGLAATYSSLRKREE